MLYQKTCESVKIFFVGKKDLYLANNRFLQSNLLFMYNTGARVQETTDLRSSWISFNNPCLVEIIGKGRKRRTCPIWEKTGKLLKELLIALGVAGFAAANIMLLSVSIWSGAEAATRDLFHWISALLAIPAVGIAGRPFFRPAFNALKARRSEVNEMVQEHIDWAIEEIVVSR